MTKQILLKSLFKYTNSSTTSRNFCEGSRLFYCKVLQVGENYLATLQHTMSRSSGLDDKPCRACTSFSEFIKLNNKELKTEDMNSKKIEDSKAHQVECPLDKDELGRGTWGLLHTIAAKYPDSPTDDQKQNMKQYLTLFSKFYPCESCAADLREELKSNPPLVENQKMLSNYLCKLHNQVNIKLGKPEYDCSKVNERWRDGWKDGSCG